MLKENSVFHDAKVSLSVFKYELDKEKKEHAQALKDIGLKYSTSFAEKKRKEEDLRHTEVIEKMKGQCNSQIMQSLMNQREKIENAVKDSLKFTSDTRVFEVLNNLSNMPLSQAEFDCIAKKVDITGNYFRKKALSEVAKSHGLHYDFAPIDAQIKALDCMSANVQAYLYGANDFEIRTPIGTIKRDIPPVEKANNFYYSDSLVSEKTLEYLDGMFSSGYSETTPSGQAAEKLSYLKDQHRPSATASFIDNAIDTEPNTAVRHEFMEKVAKDPAYAPFLEFSKYSKEFSALRDGKPHHDHIPGETPKQHAERKAAEVAKRKQQFEEEVQQEVQDMDKKPTVWEQKVDNAIAEASGRA